ncbi:MAG: DUF177 domain-containing protein [Novosphingobium sp.]|nr:DUF177 domain-containing protein [Novosphingobium sp.]MCP5403547.1 DUF177 domain-containing protein [Novosphingobium sp.]
MNASPEFSRPVDIREVDARPLEIAAGEAERAALAARFELVKIDRLEAEVALERNGDAVNATGTLEADIVQTCAVSAEDLPVSIREPLSFRFVPESAAHSPDEEIELDANELDEIEYTGTSFDLGEAIAQSLALAIDPFATGEGAEEARRRSGIVTPEDAGPFAALRQLKPKD